MEKFDKAYHKVNPNVVTFSDVIQVVKKLGTPTLDEVSLHIERGRTTTYEFLGKLVKWKILKPENDPRKANRKIWKINENYVEWKVP